MTDLDPSQLPTYSAKIDLSMKEVLMERQTYSLFMFISDVGGFNEAIIILPTILMSHYSSRIYSSEAAQEFTTRKVDVRPFIVFSATSIAAVQ